MGKFIAVLIGMGVVACASTGSNNGLIDEENFNGIRDTSDDANDDNGQDGDGDGFTEANDCDDANPNINPSAPEDCTNGVDDNCNNQVDTDLSCLSECEKAEINKDYFGCNFHALDLPNYETEKDFGIALANASATETVEVIVSTMSGVEVDRINVAPGDTGVFEDTVRNEMLTASGITLQGYKIESDFPISVVQFNSLTTVGAASTDASLLFPNHNLANDYFVMGYDSFSDQDGFMAIHATQDNTSVDVLPSSPVVGPTSTLLMKGETLLLTTSSIGSDLTGSKVTANNPISVFGGNLCAQVPLGTPYCDHLEEQIFPRQALGQSYVVPKTNDRQRCQAADYVKIMADQDQTSIHFDPPAQADLTLNAGDSFEFSTLDSIAIEGDKPFMVGQFIRSSNGTECNHEGDPSFILQVPTAQFRDNYVFLVPDTYDSDFINIVAPRNAVVTLDGTPVGLNTNAIGATPNTVSQIPVEPGSHRLESNVPVGLTVYGYGGPAGGSGVQNVSYGYPGGLNLIPINVVE